MSDENIKKESTTESKPDKDRAVKEGDVACVHYTGKLETGEVFDTSREREPLEFVVGSGQLIKGFDTNVVGMKKGDKKDIKLPPAEAYGDRDDRRVQEVPRNMLPKEPEPKKGMMLTLSAPTGQMFPAVIHEVKGDVVAIDMNHPLAGKTLNFELELVDIKDKKDVKSDSGEDCCDSGCSCDHQH